MVTTDQTKENVAGAAMTIHCDCANSILGKEILRITHDPVMYARNRARRPATRIRLRLNIAQTADSTECR